MADYKLWNALKDAKKYRWVELSHSLNNESPYWSGIPEGSVELAKTVWDWGKPELECLIQTFKFPGQFGTHIDFPGHFIKGKALSEKYDVNDLIFPLVVIDISQQAKKDPRYAVTVEDIKAYEAKYGPIPDGALVALRSDWYKKWPDMDALSGIDAEGKENAPGWSLEALEYIPPIMTFPSSEARFLLIDSWTTGVATAVMERGVEPEGIVPEPMTIFVGTNSAPTWLSASRILPLSVTALFEKTAIITTHFLRHRRCRTVPHSYRVESGPRGVRSRWGYRISPHSRSPRLRCASLQK